jgi:hypothetical protein
MTRPPGLLKARAPFLCAGQERTEFASLCSNAARAGQVDERLDTDLACVRRVQEGDVAAFDQLVIKYRERLYAVARSDVALGLDETAGLGQVGVFP